MPWKFSTILSKGVKHICKKYDLSFVNTTIGRVAFLVVNSYFICVHVASMVYAYVAWGVITAGLGFFCIQLVYESEDCDSLPHRPAFFVGPYSMLLSVASICEL